MGYLGNGLTITGTQNSKRIVVDATPNQTISTVTGGYLIGQLDVYRNGVKLVDTQDYTASDGASVTFLAAASEGDELEFVVFENFDVANALAKEGGTVNGSLLVSTASTFSSDLTVDGNVTIGGTLTYDDVTNIDSVGLITARQGIHIGPSAGVAATLTEAGGAVFTGVVTASSYRGDGSLLTGITAGYWESTDAGINTSSSVGIGTTNPQVKLHIAAADPYIRLEDTAAPTGYSQIMGTHQGAIAFSADISNSVADSHLRFDVDGSEAVRIHSGGPFSVGTANSNSAFVNINPPSGHGDQYVMRLRNDGDNSTKLLFSNKSAGLGQIWYQEAFRFVDDANSDAERLRIDSDGRLLVGSATNEYSNANLQVSNSSSSTLFVYSSDTSATGTAVLALGPSNKITGSQLKCIATEDFSSVANRTADLAIETRLDGDLAERFRITSEGHIKHTGLRNGNSENKLAFYTVPSHDTSEEDVVVFSVANESSSNQITFGGGASAYNAATEFIFRTASSVDTTVGTERLRIASSGQIGLGGANYGTSGQVIVSNGSGSAPTWQTLDTGGITTHVGTASGIVTSLFLNDATDHKVTVTGFVTFTATQSGTEGQSHTIRIVNSGIATVGFSTYFLFPSGSAPVLPTADGAVSLISFTIHDSVGAGCTQLLAGASLNFS